MKLVGGSGAHEGNILVGGLPVCDDGHNAKNALVVCRFAKKCNIFPNILHHFRPKITRGICPGCWDILLGEPLCDLTLDPSPAPSRWTTSSALATKPPSSTALISLWTIVAPMREQESSAQIPVGYRLRLFISMLSFSSLNTIPVRGKTKTVGKASN